MPVTNYYTIDGHIIGYKTTVRKDFLTDALGSITAEVDQTGASKIFDGRYKPYGGDLSSTGTRGSCGWIGSRGYRGTGLNVSSHYVRARNYSKTSGTWISIDSLWPNQKAYGYVVDRPTLRIDPSGNSPKLSYDTLNRSKGCACPNPKETWLIQWTLIDVGEISDGWIVQKIHLVSKVEDCMGGPSPKPEVYDYFEAWEVKGGKIFHGKSTHNITPGVDPWAHELYSKCRTGSFSISAEAKFFPGITIPWKDCTGSIGGPGDLPCSFDMTSNQSFLKRFMAGTGNSVFRTGTMTSSCCIFPPECGDVMCGPPDENKCTQSWTP